MMEPIKKPTLSKLHPRLLDNPVIVSACVLVSSLLITLLFWKEAHNHSEIQKKSSFQTKTSFLTQQAHSHLEKSEVLLQSLKGIMENTAGLDHKKFQHYLSDMQLKEKYPFIQTVGYISLLSTEKKNQQTTTIQNHGLPEDAEIQKSPNKLITSNIYLAPQENINKHWLGNDMFTNTAYQTAMIQTRNTGELVLSRQTTLPKSSPSHSKTKEQVQTGFLMFLPVYIKASSTLTVEDRQNNLIGWVYAAIAIEDLLADLIKTTPNMQSAEVFLGNNVTSSNKIYYSNKTSIISDTDKLITTKESLAYANLAWTLTFRTKAEDLPVETTYKPELIAIFGIIFSIIMTLTSSFLITTRLRAYKLADSMTKGLKESESRWKFALEGSGQGVWDWNIKTNEVFYSKAWTMVLGYDETEIKNHFSEWERLIHPDDLPKVKENLLARLDNKVPYFNNQLRMRCKDGSWKWVLSRGMIVSRDDNNKPLRMIGTQTDITEQRQAEESIKISARNFRSIFEESPLGIARVDSLTGRYIQVNPKFAEISGFSIEEIESTDWMSLSSNDDLTDEMNKMALLNAGKINGFKTAKKHTRPDGTTVSIRITTTAIEPHKDENPTHLTIIEDVTDLEEAEERYSDIVNTIDGIVWEADINTLDFTYVSAQAERLVGYPPEEWLKPNFWSEHIHPDDQSWAPAYCATQKNDQKPHDFEYRFICKDGSTKWLHDIVIVVTEDDKPVKLRGLMVDITQRKQAEQALRETDHHLAMIMNTADEAIITVDNMHHIRYFNHGASQIFGYPPEEVIGEHLSILIPEAVRLDHDKYIDAFSESAEMSKSMNNRHPITGFRKDGSQFTAEGSISKTETSTGNLYTAILRDVTERVETEEKIIQLNANLENKIRKRTHDLEIAKKQAEEANQEKSNFLSNMSHEIRTPMNSIIGMAYLALKTELDPKQKDYIEAIQHSGEHLLHLISDILDISKIEAGMLQIDRYDFRLGEITESLNSLFTTQAQEKDIHFSLDFSSKIPQYLKGDLQRLNQILLNLVGNAIKFTKQGKVVVKAELLSENNKDCMIRFDITDTGIGMSKEQQTNLFSLFQQVDSSITREYGGTGLGLAISKQLVELMDGEIGVESQLNVGSNFWFTLPLEKGDQKSALSDMNKMQESAYAAASINGSQILLVEDNVFNQQVAIEMLEQVGAMVVVARNGVEALDLLNRLNFDCVLMDMQMPEMGGIEATRIIRNTPSIADIKIIAMTANASQLDRSSCLAAGMDDFITKPIKPSVLYTVIAKWLKNLPLKDNTSIETAEELFDTAYLYHQNTQTSLNLVIPDSDTPDNEAMVNLETLAEIVGYDEAKIHDFSLKFIESSIKGISEIEQALQEKDLTVLSELGHRIKSPARTVGAHKFAAICEELENLESHDTIARAQSIFQQLLAIFDKTRQEIETLINNDTAEHSIKTTELDQSNNLQVLVVDDEEFQIDFVSSMLNELDIHNIFSANNGDQGFEQFNTVTPDLIICDLHMPWMDGIELLRKIAATHYEGGIILMTGMNVSQLKAAELLAKQYGLNIIGAMTKPLKKDALKIAIEKLAEVET